ncbi:hypothetical protein R1sor_008079 [Riccia sorocarpa]|uniref:Uncharacterized protein n=1 Tax=Riccia sorocarpa TaxID=122646 RepID=A0ABD3HSD1_9MARC
MGDRKRENLERNDESQSSQKPPKIGFPDLPARGSFTGSDIPYHRPVPQGKIDSLTDRSATKTSPDQGPSRSPVGNTPREITTENKNLGAHGSSAGVSPRKEHLGDSPTKRVSRGKSPRKESLTHTIAPKAYSIPNDGSPVRSSLKQSHGSLQAPATPAISAKKKSQSGHTPPRDASPHLAPDKEKLHWKSHSGLEMESRWRGNLTYQIGRSIKFVRTRHPSLQPEVLYDFDTSRGTFVKQIPTPYNKETTHTSIIDDPPPFYGFGFSPHEVEMTVHCAQVQGIITKDSLRLKPPHGVVMHSRSWLIEALRNYAIQQRLAKRTASANPAVSENPSVSKPEPTGSK